MIKVLNHKATRIDAKKGREIDDKIEIFGDLTSNDKLVKLPVKKLRKAMI